MGLFPFQRRAAFPRPGKGAGNGVWPRSSRGERQSSGPRRWPGSQAPGELIVVCSIGWKGKRLQRPGMCTSTAIQELGECALGLELSLPNGFFLLSGFVTGYWCQRPQHQEYPGWENASRLRCWGLDELNLCFQDQEGFPRGTEPEMNSSENFFPVFPAMNQPKRPALFLINLI